MITKSCANRKRARLVLLSAALAPLISLNIAHADDKIKVLYSYTDGGGAPVGFIRADGTLYGADGGGAYDSGEIFKISPDNQFSVLYAFNQEAHEGVHPNTIPTRDGKGNLYGTTCCNLNDDEGGVVYEVAPDGTYTVLHSFGQDPAGWGLSAVIYKKGNLYGVSYQGGTNGYGVIFKVTPKGDYKVLYSFDSPDLPTGAPLMDDDGNIFSTTQNGGQYGYGTIYELKPDGSKTVLHSFNPSTDGAEPLPGVVRDDNGNLYGTTQGSGAGGHGTLFELAASGTFTVLHAFVGGSGDGAQPLVDPTIIKNRNGKTELYGVTFYGGTGDVGVAYKFSALGKYKIIYNFARDNSGPALPNAPLVAGTNGKLYGASLQGGGGTGQGCQNGCGTIFELH